MRHAILGLIAGVGLTAVLTGWPADAEQFGMNAGLPQGGLITYIQKSEKLPTSVFIIDPQRQTMAVYHVGQANGKIELKSVRNFSWDLSMIDHNSNKPLPLEIRNGLERQQ